MLLLVADGKPALRLLIVAGKGLQRFDSLALENGQGEPDIGLGVLVAGLKAVSMACWCGSHRFRNSQRLGYRRAGRPASR